MKLNQILIFNNQMITKATHSLRQYLYRYGFKHSYGFAGYVQQQNNSLILSINQLKDIEELIDLYKANTKQFNSFIFSIACKKFSRMLKENNVQKKSKENYKILLSNLFIKDLINQDFSNYNAKELNGVSFLLRNLKLTNCMNKELYQLQRKITPQIIARLNKQPFNLINLINFYYDISVFDFFTLDLMELVDKILKYLQQSEDQKYIEERESVFLLHWNLIFKGLLARKQLKAKQIILLNTCIQFIGNKLSTTPINELVESICLLNYIRNTKKLYKKQNQILGTMRDHLQKNIDQLNVKSVFHIMKINIVGEDFFFKDIYDKIIQNIFDTINEDGTSQLEDGIIIQCLKHFSKKHKPISILKQEYVPKLLKFIQTKLKTGDQSTTKSLLRQFPAFVSSSFIPFSYKTQIEQIVVQNIQLPWSDIAIYSFSLRGISLQQYYQKNKIILTRNQEKEEEWIYKFVVRSINLKIQFQLNPKNEKIKQLLAQAEIQISKIKSLNLFSSPEIIRKFHYYFSPIYINNINLLSQEPQELHNILEYCIYAFRGHEITEYLNKMNKDTYKTSFLSILKKRINRNVQKLQPSMLTNILIFISKLNPLHENLKDKTEIYLILQFLTNKHLLIKLRPNQERLTGQFYIIINHIVNNIKSFDPKFEDLIARAISSLCLNTKLNKNTYYYLDFLKNALSMANTLNSPFIKQVIANECYQFGLIRDEIPAKNIQRQSQMINQLRKTQSMSAERIQQIVNSYKNKNPGSITKILVFINSKNIKLFEGLLSQLTIDITKFNNMKVFAINEILKNNFYIKKSKAYNHFIKSLGEFAEKNFYRFNLFDHCHTILRFNNRCPESYLSKFEDELNKSYISRFYQIKCFKTLFLLKSSLNAVSLEKIQYLRPKDLIFFILLQERNLENVEQRLKSALQKTMKNSSVLLDSLLCQYIAKKYPNLKEIQSILKTQSLIVSQKEKMVRILKQLQKNGEVKMSQQKAGEHTYYQINNVKIFLTKGFNSHKIQQFTKRIIKEVYDIEPILISIYSSQSYSARVITQSLGFSSEKIKVEQSIEEINPIEESQILNHDQTQTHIDQ